MPENIKSVGIYYFSGTGNTQFVGELISEELSRRLAVECNPIEKTFLPLPAFDCLGFGFPVYDYRPPKFVEEFVDSLPKNTTPVPAFIFATMGAFSGEAMLLLAKKLKKKNFFPIDSFDVIMPGNDFTMLLSKDSKIIRKNFYISSEKVERIQAWAKQLRKKLSAPETLSESMPKSKWMGKLFSKILYYPFWKLIQWTMRLMKVKPELCTQCGYCAQICPVQNIELSPYPKIGNHCVYCLRCINFCPHEAIQISRFTVGKARYKGPLAIVKNPRLFSTNKKK